MANLAGTVLMHRNLTAARDRREEERKRTERKTETSRRNPSAVSKKMESVYNQAPALSAEEQLDKAIAGGLNLVSRHSKQYFSSWDYSVSDEQASILFSRPGWLEKNPVKALEILSDDKALQKKMKDRIPEMLEAGAKTDPSGALCSFAKMTEYTAEKPDAFFDFAQKVQDKCRTGYFYETVFNAGNAAVLKQNPGRAFELLSCVMEKDTEHTLQKKCVRTLMSLYRAAPENEKIGQALYDMRSGGTRQENLAVRKTMQQALEDIAREGKPSKADSALNALTRKKFLGIDPAKAVLGKSAGR